MATAKSRASLGLAPGVPGLVYGKRKNITVPDADAADAALTTIETAAAAIETDRDADFTPDAADYAAKPAERTNAAPY